MALRVGHDWPIRAGAPQGILLACATVLIVVAISPLFPVLPRIAASFPANAGLAPAVVVLPSLFIGLLSVPAGWLGDRIGRRRLLLIGALTLFLAGPGAYFAQDFATLIACRALAGAALAATITSAVGLTGDYFLPDSRQGWLALQSGLPSIAAIGCGALGGVLGDIDWRLNLLLNLVAGGFVLGILLLTSDRMRIAPAPELSSSDPSTARGRFPLRLVVAAGALMIWTSAVLFPLAYEIGFLFAERHFMASRLAGLGSAALAAGAVAGALLAGLLPTTAGRLKLLIGFVCGGAGMIAFTVSTTLGSALAACVVCGVSQGIVIAVAAANLLNQTPEGWRGRAVGIFQATLYLSQFASPLVARQLSQALGGDQALRLYGLAALATSAVILAQTVRRGRPGNSPPEPSLQLERSKASSPEEA